MDTFLHFVEEILKEGNCQLNIDFVKKFMWTLDSVDKYCLSLDTLVEWEIDSLKENAKKRLIKHFSKNIDYTISSDKSSGGRPKENILLTVDCFKSMCILAQNAAGHKIRAYYMLVEEFYKEHLKQLYEDTQISLREKDKLIQNSKAENEELKKRIPYRAKVEVDDEQGVYISFYEEIINLYKIGKTFKVKGRMRSDTSSPFDYKLLEFIPTQHSDIAEKYIHHLFTNNRYRQFKEWFSFTDIQQVITIIKNIIAQMDTAFEQCLSLTVHNVSNNNLDSILEYVNKIKVRGEEHPEDNCQYILNIGSTASRQCRKGKIYNSNYCQTHNPEKESVQITKTEKYCPGCKINLPSVNFTTNPGRGDGLDSKCRPCTNKASRQSRHTRIKYNQKFKICPTCDQELQLIKFANYKTNPSDVCLNCLTSAPIEDLKDIAIKCTECLQVRDLGNYHINTDNLTGYNSICITCIKTSLCDYKDCKSQKKICKECDKCLPITDFYNTKSAPDGRGMRCKPCRKIKYGC